MQEKDFSQLPIVDREGRFAGVISETSISRLLYSAHKQKKALNVLELRVTDCSDKGETVDIHHDYLEALRRLEYAAAVVILDARIPVGILTNHDAVLFFREYAEGLTRIQESELALRGLIRDAFPSEPELEEATINALHHLNSPDSDNKKSLEFDDLTLADYVSIITNRKNWPHFEALLSPKQVFQIHTTNLINTRNFICHFRGDLSPAQNNALLNAHDWLSSHTSSVTLIPEAHTESQEPTPVTGKYTPLYHWLLTKRAESEITLPFSDLESILEANLPRSAYSDRTWWANTTGGSGRHSRSWLSAGWRVSTVNLTAHIVIFRSAV